MHSADFASPCRCRSCRENSSPLARRRWIAAAGVAASSTSVIASDGFLARCDSSCTTTPRACRDSFSARSVYHISRMCGAVNTERERIRIRNWMKIIFRLNKHIVWWWWHTFVFECVWMCARRLLLSAKAFTHPSKLHLNGFSPVCVRMWPWRSQGREKDLPQCGHWHDWLCVRTCIEKAGIDT